MAIGLTCVATASCGGRPPVAGRVLAASAQCIATSQIAGRRVVAPSLLRFDMIGPVDYVSDVGPGCSATTRLGSSAAISIVSGGDGGQLCRGDRVRIFDTVEAKATRFSAEPQCVLGDFRPIRPQR